MVDFSNTLSYLHSIQHCDGYPLSIVDEKDSVANLIASLLDDGYELHHISDRVSRNLSSSGGEVNVSAIVMVGLCVLCAGLASGLTQVFPLLSTSIEPDIMQLVIIFFLSLSGFIITG
jgi:hypothetical protein